MKAALCALCLCLAGCATDGAEMYAKARGDSSSKGGIVRYLSRGSEQDLKARRDNAQSRMGVYCAGAFQVVTEGPYRVLDTGAKIIPVGEGGAASQGSDEDYWLVVFKCEPGMARAPSQPTERAEHASAPLDRVALQGLTAGEAYPKLVNADRASVEQFFKSVSYKDREKMTDYIIKSKGSAAFLSWEFKIAGDLAPQEKQFVSWYLKSFTGYKPSAQ